MATIDYSKQGNGVDYGTYHLSANPKQYQPQFLNHFQFEFPDFGGKLRKAGATENTENGEIINPSEVLRVSCKSSGIPHFSQSDVTVDRGNSVLHFAGAPKWDPLQMTVYDYIGAAPVEALMAWQALSANIQKDVVGSMDVIEYKQTCYLTEFTPDYRKVRRWKLYGCWVQKISRQGFDASKKNSISEIAVTLIYDRAEIDLND